MLEQLSAPGEGRLHNGEIIRRLTLLKVMAAKHDRCWRRGEVIRTTRLPATPVLFGSFTELVRARLVTPLRRSNRQVYKITPAAVKIARFESS